MISYPIVQRGDGKNTVATSVTLPTFYMEDFSIIGLRVNDCRNTEKILAGEGISLERKNKTLVIEVEKAEQIQKVVNLLNRHGAGCEIADVADGIYQG